VEHRQGRGAAALALRGDTFGHKTLPVSPLDWLSGKKHVDAMLSKAPSPVSLGAEVRLTEGRA
jgi:hypothetical protein